MPVESEEFAPLSVGVIEGGWSPSMHRWSDAVLRLMRCVRDKREGIETDLRVNVVYQVPGDLLAPDFAGVRTGRYSKKDRALIVQVALPETAPEDVDADVHGRLLDAVAEAESWARKRRVADGLPELWSIARAAAPGTGGSAG
ncbi:MAG TPA: hypothetical protein VNA20_16775 [Frankiaceae bacterium]|nr:hypothetical protein [Frankiaceae bacterium]